MNQEPSRLGATFLILALCLVLSGCGQIAVTPADTLAPTAVPRPAATSEAAPTPMPTPTTQPPPTAEPSATSQPAVPVALLRGNLARTGVYEAAPFEGEWTVSTEAEIVSSLTIVDGTVVFGGMDGRIYAVELASGLKRWTFDAGTPVGASPVASNGIVYVGTVDGQVYGLDLASGQVRWSFDAEGPISSSAAVTSEALYMGTDIGILYAVDLESAEQRWWTRSGDAVVSSPAVAQGLVVFGSLDGKVYAVDQATGEERWRFETAGEIVSSPAITLETGTATLLIGSYDGKLYALALETGEPFWEVETGEPVVSSPAVVDGTVTFGSFDGRIYSVDLQTGAERWVFDAGAPVISSAAVTPGDDDGGYVYVGSVNGRLYALNAQTGTEEWHFQTQAEIISSPAVSGDAVVFASYDGKAYALDRRQGPEMAQEAGGLPDQFQPTPTLLPPLAATVTPGTGGLPWWNDRVFYEVFVRSFYDSDGDGIGDLQGLIQKLDYLNDGDPQTSDDLGITGIWLMPVAQSPSYHGYDVVDYRTIEEDYGTNDDFLQLMEAAHERGIAVIVDLVQNHTSNQHPWFLDAQTPGSAHEDWYIWTEQPPFLYGPWGQWVWHQAGDRYYYGLFWEGMPDLNYENGAVTEEMYDIIRFWLEDMGADGFRLDAIRHLIEEGEIQENTASTHAWLKGFYRYVHTLSPDALLVGEVWSPSIEVVKYVGDEIDMAFEFDLAGAIIDSLLEEDSADLVRTQLRVLELYPPEQYAAFLTNHDQNRVMNQLRKDTGAAKAAATLLLTSPGLPFIYYGEEIGMLGIKPDERIRTPMQWDSSETAGFTSGTPWERPSAGLAVANVVDQAADPDSLFNHYRSLIRLRTDHVALRTGEMQLLDTGSPDVYAFLRATSGEVILVAVNLSHNDVSDYALAAEFGPLSGDEIATLLLGEGEVAAPVVNAAGGFEGYRPLQRLAGRASLIVLLAR